MAVHKVLECSRGKVLNMSGRIAQGFDIRQARQIEETPHGLARRAHEHVAGAHSAQLTHRSLGLREVLEDLTTQYQIEGLVGVGQLIS